MARKTEKTKEITDEAVTTEKKKAKAGKRFGIYDVHEGEELYFNKTDEYRDEIDPIATTIYDRCQVFHIPFIIDVARYSSSEKTYYSGTCFFPQTREIHMHDDPFVRYLFNALHYVSGADELDEMSAETIGYTADGPSDHETDAASGTETEDFSDEAVNFDVQEHYKTWIEKYVDFLYDACLKNSIPFLAVFAVYDSNKRTIWKKRMLTPEELGTKVYDNRMDPDIFV